MKTKATIKGRGAAFNTPNRYEKLHLEPMEIEVEDEEVRRTQSRFFLDSSKTILARNDSPDLPFTFSINPYRGCEHGCIYCYARPAHEYLGFSAGLDFETKILVKADAPDLLADSFRKKSWQPQMVCLSGDTDCYQPIERMLKITRSCLEIFLKYRNPVAIITKNALVTRDIDILKELAALNLVSVTVSITTFDNALVRHMEPRTSAPAKRLETIGKLASHGIPTGVNASPIIPGLNDNEIPSILKEAASHGARFAGYTLLRLPGAVEQLFTDWLQRELPERAAKILNHVKRAHGGTLNDSRWGVRMRGEGEMAKTIKNLFKLSCKKYGLNEGNVEFSTKHFRRQTEKQIEMFG